MDLSRHFILLRGEPKTLQIDTIRRNGTNGYTVRFKNSKRDYHYGNENVVWLQNPEWIDPTHHKIYIGGALRKNVKEIWKFTYATNTYWRIVYNNGYTEDDATGRTTVTTSCLQEAATKDTFTYLRNVASINPLGKSDLSNGTLAEIYAHIDFIDAESAAACYLCPEKYKLKELNRADLIYPFGCNSSQKKAVSAAFEHQLSVIQGPPGTGKTQTILNIIANIVRQGKTVMVVSNNNSATANVLEKLDKYGVSFIAASLGSRDNKDLFIANQPAIPTECKTWGLSVDEAREKKRMLRAVLQQLDKVYDLQNERAELLQEQQTIVLEWKHFCIDNGIDETMELESPVNSGHLISLWLKCQIFANRETPATSWWGKLTDRIKWWWIKWKCVHWLHIRDRFDKIHTDSLIQELQTRYYLKRKEEIKEKMEKINRELSLLNPTKLSADLTNLSMSLLKSYLCVLIANIPEEYLPTRKT